MNETTLGNCLIGLKPSGRYNIAEYVMVKNVDTTVSSVNKRLTSKCRDPYELLDKNCYLISATNISK